MDLRYVYTFYRAATLKSITAAAAELGIVPGAAWKRIRELENDLNISLLDRRPDKRFRLTAAGARFLLDAEQLLDVWGQVKKRVGNPEGLGRPLRVGAIESVLHSWLIPWIEVLRQEQPSLALELTVETNSALLEIMHHGRIDILFSSAPVQSDGVRTRELKPMTMVFAAGPGVSSTRVHKLEQLAKHELITFQRNSQPYLALVELLRSAAIMDARVHAVSSIAAMMRLASSGFGVATLPRRTLEQLGPTAAIHEARCSTALPMLPIHVSWLVTPGTTALDAIVDHAATFCDE